MFRLKLIALGGKAKELELISVILPTSDGNRTILSNHMEVFVELVPGIARLRDQHKTEDYFVSEGVFHFKSNESMMLVTAFEAREELDFQRARLAADKARKLLAETNNTDELKKAEQSLKRALGRLKLDD